MPKPVFQGSEHATVVQPDAGPHRFDAVAVREGRWWIIRVAGLDAVTQARRVREIDDMAVGLVAALLDLDEKDIEVVVTIELPAAALGAWNEASFLHDTALAAEHTAAALRRSAVRDLIADQGLTQAETAHLLKISPQRVQQLAGFVSRAGPSS